MRIIAGRFKGHTLHTVPGESVRSTADRVKESLFNIIVGVSEEAEVLDLFCGAGSLGLEALSREPPMSPSSISPVARSIAPNAI